jgi:hypothetical protein
MNPHEYVEYAMTFMIVCFGIGGLAVFIGLTISLLRMK